MHDHASLVELVKIVKVAKTLTAQFSQIAQSIFIDKVFSNGQTLSLNDSTRRMVNLGKTIGFQ